MAKITAEDVSMALCRLALHYRDPDVNEATLPVLIEDYLEDLAGMNQELFKRAVPEARRACRFFPKSSDILAAAKRVVPIYHELPALPLGDAAYEAQLERNKCRVRDLIQGLATGKKPSWAM